MAARHAARPVPLQAHPGAAGPLDPEADPADLAAGAPVAVQVEAEAVEAVEAAVRLADNVAAGPPRRIRRMRCPCRAVPR